MSTSLQAILHEFSERRSHHVGVLAPASGADDDWTVRWSSRSDLHGASIKIHLPTSPAHIPNWPDSPLVYASLFPSQLEPIGVFVDGVESVDDETRSLFEACRECHWRDCEARWSEVVSLFLNVLGEQRREIVSALHRGPAQSLTAARLELSMLAGQPALQPLREALDKTGEDLVDLVHIRLKSRLKGTDLRAQIRRELDFQANWHRVPTGPFDNPMPKNTATDALALAWRLDGGEVQESATSLTFVSGDKE